MSENNKGNWIYLHRDILDKDIGDNPDKMALWSWLLLKAQWKEKQIDHRGQKLIIEPGQMFLSLKKENFVCRLGYRKTLRLLKSFEKSDRIVVLTCNRGTLVTICNWKEYQFKKGSHGTDIGTDPTLTLHRPDTDPTLTLHRPDTDPPNPPVISSGLQAPNKEIKKELNKGRKEEGNNLSYPKPSPLEKATQKSIPSDIDLVDKWLAWLALRTPNIKYNRAEFINKTRMIRERMNPPKEYEMTNAEYVSAIFDWIKQDDFWSKQNPSPVGLWNKSKSDESKKKIDFIEENFKRGANKYLNRHGDFGAPSENFKPF